MQRNTMSFKAIINNIAKENNIAAQSVLQTYMLERLLERISISKYKDNFILKGGMLISAMLGGYRVTFEASYNNEMPVIMKIDITTGDKITYKEIKYDFTLMLEKRKIQIWSYNLETIIAEKFESIIKRGPLSTRIRDYYDVYMLVNTQRKNIDNKILKDAIILTSEHRDSRKIIENWKKTVDIIKYNDKMKKQWVKYQKNNFYAEGIKYSDLITAIEKVGHILDE